MPNPPHQFFNSSFALRALKNWCGGKWLIFFLIILSFAGFLDASYLAANHYLGTIPGCSVLGNCEQVLTSSYSEVFGVPIALIGAFYYLLIFVLLFLYLDTKNTKVLYTALVFIGIGFIFSLSLIYIQLFILGAICIYCMASATISTILFILIMTGMLKYRYRRLSNNHDNTKV